MFHSSNPLVTVPLFLRKNNLQSRARPVVTNVIRIMHVRPSVSSLVALFDALLEEMVAGEYGTMLETWTRIQQHEPAPPQDDEQCHVNSCAHVVRMGGAKKGLFQWWHQRILPRLRKKHTSSLPYHRMRGAHTARRVVVRNTRTDACLWAGDG